MDHAVSSQHVLQPVVWKYFFGANGNIRRVLRRCFSVCFRLLYLLFSSENTQLWTIPEKESS